MSMSKQKEITATMMSPRSRFFSDCCVAWRREVANLEDSKLADGNDVECQANQRNTCTDDERHDSRGLWGRIVGIGLTHQRMGTLDSGQVADARDDAPHSVDDQNNGQEPLKEEQNGRVSNAPYL